MHIPPKTFVKYFLSFFFSSFVLDVWLSNISVMLRKSYEFEDLLQSSSDSCRVDWYAQSRLGLTRTLSEENVYEDIIGKLDIVTSFALNLVCVDNSCCQLSILYKRPAWFSYTAFSFHEVHLQKWLEGQGKPNPICFFFSVPVLIHFHAALPLLKMIHRNPTYLPALLSAVLWQPHLGAVQSHGEQ